MKKLIGGVLLASALCAAGATANAAQINGSTALTFNSASTTSFGSEFGAGTTGQSFLENFTFSYASPFTFSSALISIALDGVSRLNLSSLTLTGNGGTWTGVKTTLGDTQVYTLRTNSLLSGNYTLSVGGLVTGTTGGSFGGNISVAAVPEASTIAMMLGGLGVVGFAAYRRRRKDGEGNPQQRSDQLMPA